MSKHAQLADGTILEFPDETPDAVMDQAVKSHLTGAAPQAAAPAANDGDMARMVSGKPRGPVMVDGEDAATMPAWKNAAYGLVAPVADTIVGVGQMTGLMGDQRARETLERIDAVRSRTPGNLAGFAGDVGLTLALPEAKLANAGKLVRLAQGAAAGATYAGTRGVRDGESRLHNTEVGAGLGWAGQAASGALRTVGVNAAKAIPKEVREVWDKARQMGIDLTPAQLSDSRIVKYLAHQFGMLPLSGGAAAHEIQSGQWNQQVAKAIGVDAPRVTPEVYATKKAADSAAFNDLTSRNHLTVTPDLARRLHSIAQEAKIAGKDVHDSVNNAIDGLYSQMTDGVVPGRAYQALDSILGRVSKAGDTAGHYVGMVKGAIRDAMDDSIAPADKAAWNKLRTEYGNRKTIRDLVAKASGGDLPPAGLMARVLSNNHGKEAMATETRGVLGDLAKIGSRMKAPPTSGTGERILVNDLVTPWKWPGLVAAATAGRVANSNRLAQVLMRQGRGKTAQRLAKVARGAPALTPQKRNDDAGE